MTLLLSLLDSAPSLASGGSVPPHSTAGSVPGSLTASVAVVVAISLFWWTLRQLSGRFRGDRRTE